MFRQIGSGSLFQGVHLETGFQSLFHSVSLMLSIKVHFYMFELAESLIDFAHVQRIISSPLVTI